MGEVRVGDLRDRRRRAPDHGGGRHRGDDRPALLRGPLLRRLGARGGRAAPVADRDPCVAALGAAGEDRLQPIPQPADLRPGADDGGDRATRCAARPPTAGSTTASSSPDPLQLPERELLVGPYALGAWLGDGTTCRSRRSRPTTRRSPAHRGRGLRHEAVRGTPVRDPPAQPEPVTERLCAVCGAPFTPRTPRSGPAAGRAGACCAASPVPWALRPARTAGARRPDCVRCQAATTHGHRAGAAPLPGRARQQAHPERLPARRRNGSAARCSPACWTPTAPSRRAASCSSRVTSRAPRRRLRELVDEPGLPLGMSTKRVRGRHRGVVDRLHAHVQHRRRRLPARAQAAAAQGRADAHLPRGGAAGSSPTSGRSRACRCGASRSTTPTTSTSPAIDDPDAQLDARPGRRPQRGHPAQAWPPSSSRLEMSRNEITMRLLSAEARIPLQHMRNGHDARGGLDPAGPHDGRGHRRPAVHRRLARTCR